MSTARFASPSTTTTTTSSVTTSDDNTPHSPHVIIIGAGIGGLCLAQGLKKRGISFTVFERDPSADHRKQGYRLRITPEGFSALEANLPSSVLQLFRASAAKFTPGFSFLDAETGCEAPSLPGHGPAGRGPPPDAPSASGKPRGKEDLDRVFSADRLVLRSLLLTGLSDAELRFDMAFKDYTQLADGSVRVTFENGHEARGSVLVGADGTYSRVRKQYLPDATQLLDTDGRAIFGKTPLTTDVEAAVAHAMLRGTTLVSSKQPHVSLFVEPMRFTHGDPRDIAPHLPSVQDYIYWVLIARSQHFRTVTVADSAADTTSTIDDGESITTTNTTNNDNANNSNTNNSNENNEDNEDNSDEVGTAVGTVSTMQTTQTTQTTQNTRTDAQLFAMQPREAAELARNVTSTWHPSIRALFQQQHQQHQDSSCGVIGVSTMSPDIKPWSPSSVTLLGDAIHAMTPAGIGANTALQDAGLLLASFVEHGVGVPAVAAYEAQMREYAVEAIVSTAGAGKKMYGQPDFEDMQPLP